jgi:hypothetical protein
LIAGPRLLPEKSSWFQKENNDRHRKQTWGLPRRVFRGARIKRQTRKPGSVPCIPVHLGFHFPFSVGHKNARLRRIRYSTPGDWFFCARAILSKDGSYRPEPGPLEA